MNSMPDGLAPRVFLRPIGSPVVHVAAHADQRSGALGLMLLASGGMLVLAALSVAGAKPLPATVFGIEALRSSWPGSTSWEAPASGATSPGSPGWW
jgi:hypothetical protein